MSKRIVFAAIFVLIFQIGTFGLSAADSVRVETRGGVPTIVVNGKPVRGRIFFGGPTRQKPVELTDEWTTFSYEFTTLFHSENRGTLHFRPELKTGIVWLDDVTVTDAETNETFFSSDFSEEKPFDGQWCRWPVGDRKTFESEVAADEKQSGNMALRLSLAEPSNGQWPDAHVFTMPNLSLTQGKKYRVSFRARSPEQFALSFAFYRPGNPYTFLGSDDSRDLFSEQIKMAADAGVNIVSFPIGLPWSENESENSDWESVDAACLQVLTANPDALLLPRISLDPPPEWFEKYPNDVIRWDRERTSARRVAAVSSERYRREAATRLDALIRHLEERFGPHMAGYHPCGQNTGEWFYQDTWDDCYSGYAPADLTAWRTWLIENYADDVALQKAWGDETVTRSTADVPTGKLRRAAKARLFLEASCGSSDRMLFDFAVFQQKMMSDTVLTFARTVREASGGKRLSVFFFGYVFEFGAPRNGPAVSGHYDFSRMLASPDVDIFCSPISYFDRGKDGSAPAMTAAESVVAAGKIWLFEDDTRTCLTNETNLPGWRDGSDNMHETKRLLRRNTAECSVRNFATWWMDLGMSGWFCDARFWEEMKTIQALDDRFLAYPSPFTPKIVAFIDERSILIAPNNDVVLRSIYRVRRPLARCGAPAGYYFLDDFLADKTDARLNVFLNPWRLDKATRAKLAQKAKESSAIWLFGSGYLDEETGFSLDGMRELTGFAAEKIQGGDEKIVVTDAGRSFGLSDSDWGGEIFGPVGSRFAFTNVTPAETLAVYADGKAAIVRRINEQGNISVALGVPGLTDELVRGAARESGVHLFTQSTCNVYANGPFVILHAVNGGTASVDFGAAKQIRDIVSGKIIGTGPTVNIELNAGDTRIFEILE